MMLLDSQWLTLQQAEDGIKATKYRVIHVMKNVTESLACLINSSPRKFYTCVCNSFIG